MRNLSWIKVHSFLIYLFCQVFFLINIQFPKGQNFDEFHYVPSAKQFLNLSVNQNWEHPPLGKQLIAVGIGLFGDQPLGWRFMSTVFGSLTCVGMYLLAWVFFRSTQAALWVALITLANQLLYVQSRIGMLDTFMFTWIIWGLVAFCATWIPYSERRWALFRTDFQLLSVSGALMGLATSCKWFGLMPWLGCLALAGGILILKPSPSKQKRLAKKALRQSHLHPQRSASEDLWWRSDLWQSVKWHHLILSLGVIPVFFYFLPFLPFLWIPEMGEDRFDWLQMQWKMWDGQLRVVTSHPYMSQWWDWPLLLRPIWYAYEKDPLDPETVRGVLLLGNPLIMWLGLVALAKCFWDAWRDRSRVALLISYFYFVFYACWILIPRKISFYYYYYPAGMMLSFALGYCFFSLQAEVLMKELQKYRYFFLGAAVGLFLYFFPILGALKISAASFTKWMWFGARWI